MPFGLEAGAIDEQPDASLLFMARLKSLASQQEERVRKVYEREERRRAKRRRG